MLGKLIALLLVACATAEYIKTYECPSTTTHSKDIQMKVTDCKETDERCPLFRGKTHGVEIFFTPTKNYTGRMDFRVYGVFPTLTVPYRGKADAYDKAAYADTQEKLKDLGIFLAERQVQHLSDFAVSTSYPKVELNVRFAIIEKRTKEYLLCREIKVGIKDLPTAEITEAPQDS